MFRQDFVKNTFISKKDRKYFLLFYGQSTGQETIVQLKNTPDITASILDWLDNSEPGNGRLLKLWYVEKSGKSFR